MKTSLRFSFFLLYGLAGIWLVDGCKPAGNEADPQTNCRIQRYTALSTSQFYTENRETAYSYDGQENLQKVVSAYRKKPVNGAEGAQTSTTTNTYAYNNEGYLTASTENILTTTVFAGKTTEEQFTTVSSYSYTSGRLTAKSSKFTGPYSSSNSSFITTYEYDSAGDLTKMITGNATWTYQKNQLIDYVEKSGSAERRPYTIQNGVITRSVFPGSTDELVVTALYDNQQRLIQRDEYLNGQLNRSDVQTWSDAKPSSAALPRFKGFPVVLPNASFPGPANVLATRKQYYWNSISKTMQPFSDDTYTVQVNGQRFISAATITSKHPLAADQDNTTTETYTYSGCL